MLMNLAAAGALAKLSIEACAASTDFQCTTTSHLRPLTAVSSETKPGC